MGEAIAGADGVIVVHAGRQLFDARRAEERDRLAVAAEAEPVPRQARGARERLARHARRRAGAVSPAADLRHAGSARLQQAGSVRRPGQPQDRRAERRIDRSATRDVIAKQLAGFAAFARAQKRAAACLDAAHPAPNFRSSPPTRVGRR